MIKEVICPNCNIVVKPGINIDFLIRPCLELIGLSLLNVLLLVLICYIIKKLKNHKPC